MSSHAHASESELVPELEVPEVPLHPSMVVGGGRYGTYNLQRQQPPASDATKLISSFAVMFSAVSVFLFCLWRWPIGGCSDDDDDGYDDPVSCRGSSHLFLAAEIMAGILGGLILIAIAIEVHSWWVERSQPPVQAPPAAEGAGNDGTYARLDEQA